MPRFRFRCFTAFAGCLWIATSLLAQEKSSEPVRMQCLDSDGKPVAGAEIHLFQYDGKAERYQSFGPFKSNAEGKAICEKLLFTNDAGNFDRWFYARIPGRLVGAARSAKWTNQKPFNVEGKVRLFPSAKVEGKVTVPDGFDRRKVTVRVITLHISTGPQIFDYESFSREHSFPGLDTALPEVFERHPDAEGRIQFDDVPVKGQLYLATVGVGLAEAQWRNNETTFDRPIELTPGRECVLTGRALTPEGKPAAGMKVSAHLVHAPGALYYLSIFQTVTDEKGEYSIHGLPQKIFNLSVIDPKGKWVFRPMQDLLIQTGDKLDLDLNLETGVLVSGRVFDSEGKPLAGAALSALNESPKNDTSLANDMSDAEGRYKLRLPAGKARLYFNALPDGFAYPEPRIMKTLDITTGQADIEKLDFTLQRQEEKR